MIKYDFSNLSGDIVTRDDFEYEECRKAWNRAIEKYPLLIVYCYKVEDVQNAILFARENFLEIRIRSGSHHYEGYSTGNDVVVIDVSKMNGIYINEEQGFVKIQGGVRNEALYEAIGKKGYPFPGGGCPTVGVVGFTLGGGWGYSSRLLGLGCDNLLEVELVNNKGELITCNESCNEDLFWALRGCGGGNFGVIVSMTFKLPEKIENTTLINIDFPNIDFDEKVNLIELWQQKYKTLDKRANFKLAAYNSLEKGKGVKIIGLFYGSKEEANKILTDVRECVSCGIYTLQYIEVLEAYRIIQYSHPDYERYKSCGRFVYRDFTREEIKGLLSLIDERAEGSTYTAVTLYGLGGAIRDFDGRKTSFYHRNANFVLGFQSVWEEAKYAPINRKWLVSKLDYIKSITEGSFVNFPCAENNDYEKEYYGDNKEILRIIKEKYDKDDLFNFEQDIKIKKNSFYNFLVKE